jgi:hypothetical protein
MGASVPDLSDWLDLKAVGLVLAEAQSIATQVDLDRIAKWSDLHDLKLSADGKTHLLEPHEILATLRDARDAGAHPFFEVTESQSLRLAIGHVFNLPKNVMIHDVVILMDV